MKIVHPSEVIRIYNIFKLNLSWDLFLQTAREGNVFTGICHSVHNPPHGYSITACPCYNTVSTHPTGMLSCWNSISITKCNVISFITLGLNYSLLTAFC